MLAQGLFHETLLAQDGCVRIAPIAWQEHSALSAREPKPPRAPNMANTTIGLGAAASAWKDLLGSTSSGVQAKCENRFPSYACSFFGPILLDWRWGAMRCGGRANFRLHGHRIGSASRCAEAGAHGRHIRSASPSACRCAEVGTLVFFFMDIRFRWYSAPLHRVTAATLNLRFWVGVVVLLLNCLRARPELYLIQLCVDTCWPHP